MVSFYALSTSHEQSPGEIPAELFVVELGGVLLFFM